MPERRCMISDAEIAESARLSFADIVRDLMQTLVSFERGPLAFAWAGLTQPGHVAREYVEDRRGCHCGPFATQRWSLARPHWPSTGRYCRSCRTMACRPLRWGLLPRHFTCCWRNTPARCTQYMRQPRPKSSRILRNVFTVSKGRAAPSTRDQTTFRPRRALCAQAWFQARKDWVDEGFKMLAQRKNILFLQRSPFLFPSFIPLFS
jgi:hypothetical protein